MSLAVAEPEQKAPEDGPCQEGCLICTTGTLTPTAYRPHALNQDCWCCFGKDGSRGRQKCVMAYWVQDHTPNM